MLLLICWCFLSPIAPCNGLNTSSSPSLSWLSSNTVAPLSINGMLNVTITTLTCLVIKVCIKLHSMVTGGIMMEFLLSAYQFKISIWSVLLKCFHGSARGCLTAMQMQAHNLMCFLMLSWSVFNLTYKIYFQRTKDPAKGCSAFHTHSPVGHILCPSE